MAEDQAKNQERVTRAEQRARAYGKQLEAAGFFVTYNIMRREPTLYSDGEVMLPGLVSVGVHATAPGPLGDSYGFGFLSWLPAPGRRASTKWSHGCVYRVLDGVHEMRNERELASRIGTETFIAGRRAERKAAAEASAEGEQRQAQ
jgi:hypothetical protein